MDDLEMEEDALLEMVNAPAPPPEEGRVENLLFLFSPLLASRSVVHKTSTKEHFPLSLGPHRGQGVVDEPVLSPLSRQRAAVGGSREQSIVLLTHPLPERRLVLHTRCPRFGPATRCPSRVPVFLLLPHRGYVGGFVSATCAVSGSLASTSVFKSVWLAPSDHQTRLRFSSPGVLPSLKYVNSNDITRPMPFVFSVFQNQQ